MPNLVFQGTRQRTKTTGTKGTTKAKTALKFLEYDMVTPMIPKPKGRGARRCGMIDANFPDQNVVLIKFVWKKQGTEEQRREELRGHLSDNGIEVSFTDDDDDDDETD